MKEKIMKIETIGMGTVKRILRLVLEKLMLMYQENTRQNLNLELLKKYETMCNDLKNVGVKDILIACMDKLKGLPDAIKAVFPNVSTQSCIIHQIRNSIKYIASKYS